MKILGISGSPRKQGNTEVLIEEALQAASQEGAEVELFTAAGKTIASCDGCRACDKTGKCHIKDDMQPLYDKLLAADGIIFGTPVYMFTMTSLTKAIIERTFALGRPDRNLKNKVGGVIVTAGSLGEVSALKDIYFFFVTRQILPANFVAAYASGKGDVKDLPKCMVAAGNLGRQMVKIIQTQFRYPAEFDRTHMAFGTHTK
jgi:multimeric flavodoxin WrbA